MATNHVHVTAAHAHIATFRMTGFLI